MARSFVDPAMWIEVVIEMKMVREATRLFQKPCKVLKRVIMVYEFV